MPAVVKLGTSITASDDGELRMDVLAAICDEVARLDDVVVVTSGAIARGIRVMELGARPTAASASSARATASTGSPASASSGCCGASTSRTRRRWPTSSTA